MKLTKTEIKKIEEEIQAQFKEHGFKGSKGFLYHTDKTVYMKIVYLIVESKKLIISADIKKYSYDNLFWDIMKMGGNAKKGDSFRANGAFTSPSIPVKRIVYEVEKEYQIKLKNIVDEIIIALDDFIENHDINEYVILHNDTRDGGDLLDGSILKCLAYHDIGESQKAEEVAIHRIENGDNGRFENEGKGFFEWVLKFNQFV